MAVTVSNACLNRVFAQTLPTPSPTVECDPKEIEPSINRLGQGDTTSFDLLVSCKSQAVPAVMQLLKHQDENIRIVGIAILGEIGLEAKEAIPYLWEILKNQKDAVSALITALKDQDEDVRSNAAEALGSIGKDAVPALISALKDQNEDVRSNATEALGSIGKEAKDAVPALISALKDQDERVRFRAAEALGNIAEEAKDTVPALIAALKDESESVRYEAANALGEFGQAAKPAVPELTIVAQKDRCLEPRQAAIQSLGQIIPNQVDSFSSQPEEINPCFRLRPAGAGRQAVAQAVRIERRANPPVMCRYPVVKAILSWKCP